MQWFSKWIPETIKNTRQKYVIVIEEEIPKVDSNEDDSTFDSNEETYVDSNESFQEEGQKVWKKEWYNLLEWIV